MPQSSNLHYVVVSAIGADRPGVANKLLNLVSSLRCNIVDSQLAVYGDEFTLVMLLEGRWSSIAQVEARLPLKSQELGLICMLKRTTSQPSVKYPNRSTLQVTVPDSPGVIESFTCLISKYQLNLRAMKSEVIQQAGRPPVLAITFDLQSESPDTENFKDLQLSLEQLSKQLGATYTIHRLAEHQPELPASTQLHEL